MLTYLSMGKTMKEAVEFGTAASAITVTRLGAADSIPSAEEVEV
jgi:sugar/nucleoside kinase (ribokinase family)